MPTYDPAERNWDSYVRAKQAHDTYVRMAEKCNNYFLGEQWDETKKAEIENEGRPALTLNEIMQVVLAIRGHYSTQRADIVFRPKSGDASDELAEVLTKVADAALDATTYGEHEATMVEDGWIEDRGFVDIRMSYDKNILGEIEVTSLDPREVVLDPNSREYDPDTWTEVTRMRWLSLDDIEIYYGKDKRSSVMSLIESGQTYGDRSVRYDTFGNGSEAGPSDTRDEARVRSVLVLERQHWQMGMVKEFVDLVTGKTRAVPESWDDAKVQAVAKTYQLGVRKRLAKRIRWTVSADRITLFDDWSSYDHFTIVPYFPIFRRGRPSGLVRHLLDPQEQLNKIESQVLHTINTTANSGWMIEAGSLVNMTEDDLEQRGAETGLVLVYGKNREKPEKIKPNQVPAGLEMYAGKALQYIRDIPGASALLGGMADPEVSGIAIDRQTSKALAGLQMAFDNLNKTRRLVGIRVLSLIQKFYTEPRIYRVLNWRDPDQPQEQIAINQQIAGEIVNNVTIGEYDVMATSAPARDTWDDVQFSHAIEMRREGIMIPDHHVIRVSRMAGKKQIAEEVKQIQGFGGPSEMDLMMQQIMVQRAQLELAELDAKVLNLQADAQLKQSKAQVGMAAEQRQLMETIERLRLEADRLRADVAKKAADLQSKLELAQIHTSAKSANTRYTTLNRSFEAEKERESRLTQENIRGGWQATIAAQRAAQTARAARKPPTGGRAQ